MNIKDDEDLLEHIMVNRTTMVGKPVIRGTRLTVEFILSLLAHGSTYQEILSEYDGITIDDIHACILFATKALEESAFLPLNASVV